LFEDLCRFNEVVGGLVQGESADGRRRWDDDDGLAGPLGAATNEGPSASPWRHIKQGFVGSQH